MQLEEYLTNGVINSRDFSRVDTIAPRTKT